MKQLGLSAPVYATEPVHRLGLLTMYDQFLSRKIDLLSKLPSFWKGRGIVIAPHVAGHMLGGSIWRITKDGEDVIYAVDYNHRKERHLNGTVLQSFVRPAVLITDAYHALYTNQTARQQRDKEFLDTISKHLEVGGNVLLPVDTAGRVLELLLILEQHWSQRGFSFPIYFLTYVSSSTIDYVKSFLEWMSDSISKSFETSRDNAFLLRHVTLLINKTDLDNAPPGPNLEAGFAREIFVEWANDPRNLVLFTETGQFGTLARMLQSAPPPKFVKVTMSKRVPLAGEELIAYEEEQNRLKREEALRASLVKEVETKASHGSDDNSSEPMVIDTKTTHDVVGSHGPAYKDILIDGFVPPSSSVAPMFPFYDNTSEWDDFGEVINPDDYVIKDEDMDRGAMHNGGDVDGRLDEATASLMLDTRPSKVISNELIAAYQ
ncbi:unnamed protein product [Arabidopsis lyrata]|nr:unnamed protein product [Arabidopsis lyrata]